MKSAQLQVGDTSPDAIVLDSEGTEIALSSLWSAGPTLLTFLRHFG